MVARGAADKLFVNTTGIGIVRYGGVIGAENVAPGDLILVNGPIGDHGAAILLHGGTRLEAAVIGRVEDREHGRLILRTSIGGSRQIDLPLGELVPRIC